MRLAKTLVHIEGQRLSAGEPARFEEAEGGEKGNDIRRKLD